MDGGSVICVGSTLCAIVKNERRYLLEWIAYHRLIGFDRLVIYNNDSDDGSDALLDSLDAAGFIEHRRWPSVEGQSPQRTAYNDAVHRCETEWICFLDADEFLALRQDPDIASFLTRFPAGVSAIAMNWRLFGSSRHVTRRRGLVIRRFTLAAPRPHHLNRHCKTIARASAIEEMHIHSCTLRHGLYVDSNGQAITIERMGFTPTVEHRFVQVNHYVVKSLQEFRDKQRRGNANRPPGAVDKYTGRNGNYFEHHDHNEEPDEILVSFGRRVQAEIDRLQAVMDDDGRASSLIPARSRVQEAAFFSFRSRRRANGAHRPVAAAMADVGAAASVAAPDPWRVREVRAGRTPCPEEGGATRGAPDDTMRVEQQPERQDLRQEDALSDTDHSAALAALAGSHLSLRLLTALLTNFPVAERQRVGRWLEGYEKELAAASDVIPESLAKEFPVRLSTADAATVIRSEIAALRLLQKAIAV